MISHPSSASPRGPIIAIDGPAGTGKSSVTYRLAQALGFMHVDTGAIYRAIALLCLEALEDGKVSPGEENRIACEYARTARIRFQRIEGKDPTTRVLAGERDLTELIRSNEISQRASRISGYSEVREALLELQRSLGAKGWTILEGRDIGTVVFPEADLKFFLTANVAERTRRRLIELEITGREVPSVEELKHQILQRDLADSTRAVAPLRQAEGAIRLDTSDLSLDEVVDRLEATARERLAVFFHRLGAPPTN